MNRQQIIKALLLSIRNWTLSTAESRFLYIMAQIAEQTPVMGSLQVLELFRDCAKGSYNEEQPIVLDAPWTIPREVFSHLQMLEEQLTLGNLSENQPFASDCGELSKKTLEILEMCTPV